MNIHTSSSEWRSSPVPTVKLFPEGSEDVGSETLYEVNLDVAGIVLVYM